MNIKQDEVTKGLVITIAGAAAIYWSMTQPCNIAVNAYTGMTTEVARLMCLTIDPKLTIILLIGSAALFTGAGRLFKNI